MKNKKYRHTPNYLLTPDYVFEKFTDISPEFLQALGIKALVIDIDNTLAPYEQDLPDEKTVKWFKSLEAAGIKSALISNNEPARVETYNSILGIPAFPDAKKPSTKAILAALEQMGIDTSEAAGLGDQLLTDTWAVHKLEMISLIVPPINDKKNFFFRFKRWIEKPFMRRYYKLKSKD